jgi:predicted DNA-binding WGR domain protein
MAQLGEGQAHAAGWELTYVNPAVNSDKFYRVFVVESDVVVHFGRQGSGGQTHLYSQQSPAAAQAFARQQTTKKRAKGYQHSGPSRLFVANLDDVRQRNGGALTQAWQAGEAVSG